MKNRLKREILFEELDFVDDMLSPKNIVIVGSTDREVFAKYERRGINMILFPSFTSEKKDRWMMMQRNESQKIRNLKQGELF